jgi:hypothetical protein
MKRESKTVSQASRDEVSDLAKKAFSPSVVVI